MTPKPLLLLCLIRSGVRTVRGLAQASGLPLGTVNDYLYNGKAQRGLLAVEGLVEMPTGEKGATLRLTSKGREAVGDCALVYEDGGAWVGRVEVK